MEFAEIDHEIHFLIKLPEHIKKLYRDREITLPILSPNELGEYTGNSKPMECQAIESILSGAKKDLKVQRSIARARRLVKAINSLDVDDRRSFIEYYTKGKKDCRPNVFEQVYLEFTKIREIKKQTIKGD